MGLERFFGLANSLKGYSRRDLWSDTAAGLITAILLVPQGIAFAMLAGLPPETGLYASILPMMVYALLGSSRTLSVGPVSVAAIMVASALHGADGNDIANATVLALEGGAFLLVLSAIRVGSLVNLISQPVLSGFTSGAAILIILSQLPHLLGAPPALQHTGMSALLAVPHYFAELKFVTLGIGSGSVLALILLNQPFEKWLRSMGASTAASAAISKLGPLFVVLVTTILVATTHSTQVSIVGPVPSGLPSLSTTFLHSAAWLHLAPSALFIALIGYVESIAIAKALAEKYGQQVNANQELVALGAANIAAAFSGTMPVAGGFSRTMVNFAAGAKSQIAALVTALVIALAVMYFAQWFEPIPKAALAAIITVAILPLVDFSGLAHWWRTGRANAVVFLVTFLSVLLWGIEQGLSLGIVMALVSRYGFAQRHSSIR